MNDKREREAVDLACQLLEKKSGDKYIICKPYGKKIAGTKEEIEIYSDDGDIILIERGLKTITSVEVKRLSEDNFMKDFTDRKSWSLPNFIVDGVWQVKNKKLKVNTYMCFNSPLTAVAIINVANTIDKWEIENKRGNGGLKDYYVVNPDLIRFELVENLLK